MVNLHRATHGFQVIAGGNAGFRFRVFHKADTQHLVLGLAHPLQGFLPGVLVDHHRLHLRREERPVRHRQHIHTPRPGLLRQDQAFAVLVFADVLGHVVFKFFQGVFAVLVIHTVLLSGLSG